jgi:type II secretory pathway pseudopilin PulG
MKPTRAGESGESLVEILIALVIIGLVVSAYFATFWTSSTGSTTHRSLVTADAVLRDYAEAIKRAVRDPDPTPGAGCGAPSSTTFTVTYTQLAGFPVSSNPAVIAQPCPPPATVQHEVLTVTLPSGMQRSMTIEVRTP